MKQFVAVEEPHVESLAARVLLERDLRGQQLEEWLEFKRAFLERREERDGTLICEYCGRAGLVAGDEFGPSMQATIDHVVPLSKGGAERDEGNLAVACRPCNQRKGDSEVAGETNGAIV